jgi:hypothetical protein
MPYTIKQARNTSYYKNVQDADEHKLLKSLEEEKKRAAISGSALDATDPLRDDNGYLLSYEDPKNPGNSMEQSHQYVRLPLVQKSSNKELWLKFFGPEDMGGNEKGIFREIEGMIPSPPEEPVITQPELEGLRIELENKIAAQDELNVTLDETITELQEELEKVATGG